MASKWTHIYLVPGGGNFANLPEAKREAQIDANAYDREVWVVSRKMLGEYGREPSVVKFKVFPKKSNPRTSKRSFYIVPRGTSFALYVDTNDGRGFQYMESGMRNYLADYYLRKGYVEVDPPTRNPRHASQQYKVELIVNASSKADAKRIVQRMNPSNKNEKANYYGVVGGYAGAYKRANGQWIGVREFNRHLELKPKPLIRWQGPPNAAILRALKHPSW